MEKVKWKVQSSASVYALSRLTTLYEIPRTTGHSITLFELSMINFANYSKAYDHPQAMIQDPCNSDHYQGTHVTISHAGQAIR